MKVVQAPSLRETTINSYVIPSSFVLSTVFTSHGTEGRPNDPPSEGLQKVKEE